MSEGYRRVQGPGHTPACKAAVTRSLVSTSRRRAQCRYSPRVADVVNSIECLRWWQMAEPAKAKRCRVSQSVLPKVRRHEASQVPKVQDSSDLEILTD